MDEELLQEGPVSLDFTSEHDNLSDGGEGLLPLDALVFKGGQVAGGEHGINLSLVLFKLLEVFFAESKHLDIGALMLLEVKSDIDPESLDIVQSLFHLGFLSSLITDFFDVFTYFTEL